MVAAIAWPVVVWHFSPALPVRGLTMLSFLSVSTSLAAELVTREPQISGLFAWAVFRIAFLRSPLFGLLWWTIRLLDRRAAHTPARGQCTLFDSAINQKAPRAVLWYKKCPSIFPLERASATITLGTRLVFDPPNVKNDYYLDNRIRARPLCAVDPLDKVTPPRIGLRLPSSTTGMLMYVQPLFHSWPWFCCVSRRSL